MILIGYQQASTSRRSSIEDQLCRGRRMLKSYHIVNYGWLLLTGTRTMLSENNVRPDNICLFSIVSRNRVNTSPIQEIQCT